MVTESIFYPVFELVQRKKTPPICLRNKEASSLDTYRFYYKSALDPIRNTTTSSWAFSCTYFIQFLSQLKDFALSIEYKRYTADMPLQKVRTTALNSSCPAQISLQVYCIPNLQPNGGLFVDCDYLRRILDPHRHIILLRKLSLNIAIDQTRLSNTQIIHIYTLRPQNYNLKINMIFHHLIYLYLALSYIIISSPKQIINKKMLFGIRYLTMGLANQKFRMVFLFIFFIRKEFRFVIDMIQKHISQDSVTLSQFININKKSALERKQMRKQTEIIKRERKASTQLSIFGWLNQSHPNQKNLLHTLDKYLILKIFSYVRITDLVNISHVSSYLFSCYKSLWNDKEYFCQLETDKFTEKELGKLMEKSSRLDHIKYLKHIYSGKSIKYCREKIKIKVGEWSPNTGGMLQVFSVQPKSARSASTFIMDSHIHEIVNSSFRSLLVIELVRCSFLKEFTCLSRCLQLKKLTITYNDNFSTQNLGLICKRCKDLESIHLQECKKLDQNIFQHLQYAQNLEELFLRNFKQSFFKLNKLDVLANLTFLDINGSLITDIEAHHITKLKHLAYLSIKNCPLLNDSFIDHLTLYLPQTHLSSLEIDGNHFSEGKVQHLLTLLRHNL